MSRNYKNGSYNQRVEIFTLLESYARGTMDFKDGERLVSLLTSFNPYTYKTCPRILFEHLGFENSVAAFYQEDIKSIVFNRDMLYSHISHDFLDILSIDKSKIPDSVIKTFDLFSILNTIGHEMKHYIQYKSFNIPSPNNEYGKYLNNMYASIFYKNRIDIDYRISLMIVLSFIKKQTKIPYFEDISEEDFKKINQGRYLIALHEKDARIAGFNFTMGMIATLLNDPLSKLYKDATELLQSIKLYGKQLYQHGGKDNRVYDLFKINDFSEHLFNLFENELLSTKAINSLSAAELRCFCGYLCIGKNVNKCQSLIDKYSINCPNFSKELYSYSSGLYPNKKFSYNSISDNTAEP